MRNIAQKLVLRAKFSMNKVVINNMNNTLIRIDAKLCEIFQSCLQHISKWKRIITSFERSWAIFIFSYPAQPTRLSSLNSNDAHKDDKWERNTRKFIELLAKSSPLTRSFWVYFMLTYHGRIRIGEQSKDGENDDNYNEFPMIKVEAWGQKWTSIYSTTISIDNLLHTVRVK